MIPGIVELTSKTIYGLTSRNIPIYRFKPLNTSLPDYLVGCSLKDRTKNMIGLIEKTDVQRSNLIRLIGPCGDLKSEKEGLLLQYSTNIWKKFDKKNIKFPMKDKRNTVKGYTFNIDPIGCRDIDDVITVGEDETMYITIADVASWMNVNPDLFEKARTIGQTLYDDGKVVSPLLPIQEECSLFPNQERLGISLKFKWTGNEIKDVSFEKVNIINNESLTYEQAQSFQYSKLLKEIASYLAGYELEDSHNWIEQFMLFYNYEVAKVLVEKKEGIIRYQEEADIEKLNEYKNIGINETFLANKSAKYGYASEPKHHWGLKKDHYCHASSPIRRFADIVNQMVLCEYLIPAYDVNELNELQQQSKKYERDGFFLQKILETDKRLIQGVTLSDHRIWVPEWKRIITCKNIYSPGTTGILKYSLDMNQPTWKRRMVFKFEDTNCQE